jgi:hypothetical protein
MLIVAYPLSKEILEKRRHEKRRIDVQQAKDYNEYHRRYYHLVLKRRREKAKRQRKNLESMEAQKNAL